MTTESLLSVRDSIPSNWGGVNAREGFAYQDDIAAAFYIEMLRNADLYDVSCETHDDILLLRNQNGLEIAEYVQVKSESLEQLWSRAKLCSKNKSPTRPDGVGTSLLEKSLVRDEHKETSWFRIVTSRQCVPELEVLALPRDHELRTASYPPFKELLDYVCSEIGEFKSKKGNGPDYWLKWACWDVVSDVHVVDINRSALALALHQMGVPADPDSVRCIYDNLRALAKETAEFNIGRWKEKRICRAELIEKVKQWTSPYPGDTKIRRLKRKLKDAALDPVNIAAAEEQRRFYLKRRREGAYLSTNRAEDVELAVLSALHALRARLDSGELRDDGIEFHKRCLRTVATIERLNQASVLSGAYLSGCMYEITARCSHRFRKIRR